MRATTFVRLLISVEKSVVFIGLAGLVISVVWGVLSRYVTAQPAPWTGEMSGILFAWVVFFGIMSAFRNGRHIRVSLFLDLLPPRSSAVLGKLADLVVIVFLGYATVLSVQMAIQGTARPSTVLRIPFSYVYAATVITFGVMFINASLRLLRVIPEPEPLSTAEEVL